MDEQGSWYFSPVYDITFSNVPGGEHSMMYVGEGKNPTKEHLLKLAKKHGFKNSDDVINEVQEAIRKGKSFSKIAGVSEKSEKSIGSIFKKLNI